VDEELLAGGVANAGKVRRVGDRVVRPANANSESIHRFLRALRPAGFQSAPQPIAINSDGTEELVFIEGDVAVPPFPSWAQTDAVLASTVELLRGLHTASARVDITGLSWSSEMADPEGGPVVCHNDVCPENVVFRGGEAVGLLDWDFAAPGRPEFDLANFARMCVPVDDDLSTSRLGFAGADRPARLRLVADRYGLDLSGRRTMVAILDRTIEDGGQFLLRRIRAGDPGFVAMWKEIGGMDRFDRRRRWWERHRGAFAAAMA
jgi:aminoglycoside phosphotransferase (APT) family kinase protein